MATGIERAEAFEKNVDEVLVWYRVAHLIFLPLVFVPRNFFEHAVLIQMKLLQTQDDTLGGVERNVSIYSNQKQEIIACQHMVREIGATFMGVETSSVIDDYRKFKMAKFNYCGVQGFHFK